MQLKEERIINIQYRLKNKLCIAKLISFIDRVISSVDEENVSYVTYVDFRILRGTLSKASHMWMGEMWDGSNYC